MKPTTFGENKESVLGIAMPDTVFYEGNRGFCRRFVRFLAIADRESRSRFDP